MLAHVPGVLSKADVALLRDAKNGGSPSEGVFAMAKSPWLDKRESLQSEQSQPLEALVQSALLASPAFLSAAVPLRMSSAQFSRQGVGDDFDQYDEPATRGDERDGSRIRIDLVATLFLSEPDAYDGGVLIVEDIYGSRQFKPPAGDVIIHSAGIPRLVTSVTRGVRLVCSVALQSLIRADEARSLVCDLDASIQELSPRIGADDPDLRKLTSLYHNLVRYWGEA